MSKPMPKRKNLRPSPKVVAVIKALRCSLGPMRPGTYQDLADNLVANGCTVRDLQKAATIFDDLLLREQQISDITGRLCGKNLLPESFTYEELLRIAAASGDQDARSLIDADVVDILQSVEILGLKAKGK
jgi:hypothetical protein